MHEITYLSKIHFNKTIDGLIVNLKLNIFTFVESFIGWGRKMLPTDLFWKIHVCGRYTRCNRLQQMAEVSVFFINLCLSNNYFDTGF